MRAVFEYTIELVDVGLSRIEFVPQVREHHPGYHGCLYELAMAAGVGRSDPDA